MGVDLNGNGQFMNSIEGVQDVTMSLFSHIFSRSNPRPTLANFNSSISASCQCFVSGAISSIDLMLGIIIYGSEVSAHAILDPAPPFPIFFVFLFSSSGIPHIGIRTSSVAVNRNKISL